MKKRPYIALILGAAACSGGSDFSSSTKTEKAARRTPSPVADDAEPDPTATPASETGPSIATDSSEQKQPPKCTASFPTDPVMAGQNVTLTVLLSGADSVYINGKTLTKDSMGMVRTDVPSTAAEQTVNVYLDSTPNVLPLCSIKLAAGWQTCKLEQDLAIVNGSGCSQHVPCAWGGHDPTCEYVEHTGSTSLSLPASAKNIHVVLTHLNFDDNGGYVVINGATVADYRGERSNTSLLAHGVDPNVDVTAHINAGANSFSGGVLNIQCDSYNLSAHLSGTYQAPTCN